MRGKFEERRKPKRSALMARLQDLTIAVLAQIIGGLLLKLLEKLIK